MTHAAGPGSAPTELGAAARAALAHVAAAVTPDGPPLDPRWRVTVHFHPDRAVPGGGTVIERLVRDGIYRSQFETMISNGGLTAHPGGDRWRWEQRIFGGAYDRAPASERPVYGSLDHRGRAEGGSIRFGSAHLRLTADALDRCTFCYPDSTFAPTAFGTRAQAGLVGLADADRRDRLDDYVEAQLHGGLRIARDVEALVLDPAHRGTRVEQQARALGVSLAWHQGFRLRVAVLAAHAVYRGPDVVALGRAVAVDGVIDADVLGRAARAGHDLQTVKRLWHCVARFGDPAD
ncbi:hypothetical protein FHX74_000210 [Friedmanniella endophytica]|uniref:DUF3626 domain-containing protein n=1 Tax=Microlunatus kandeliicorticis TaxID=1759536 RepID=A0A7W3P482_9ACTN|nr:DUF3626 domain-containing protein [Microlunatus kandeliicorticis]MBA8792616.1 hypothetical protein [Microlunatus kandeliicorticis]